MQIIRVARVRRYTVVSPKMLFNVFVIFCAVQLAVGQSFTSVDPANGIVVAGENITVRCDSGLQGVQPAVTTTSNGVVIENITPQGTGSQIRIFRASAFTRNNNGAVLTCRDPDEALIGSITVIVQYEPEITGLANVTVNEGESISFNITVDANPSLVVPRDVRVTPNLPAADFNPINANTVSITIPSVSAANAGEYMVTANNSVGMDTKSFVLTVNVVTPTTTMTSTGTSAQSVTATKTTTDLATSTTVTTTATTSISSTPSPTNDGAQGNSANMKFASATTVLLLILAVLLFND